VKDPAACLQGTLKKHKMVHVPPSKKKKKKNRVLCVQLAEWHFAELHVLANIMRKSVEQVCKNLI
jgi:hypothetical protein